MTWDGYKGVSFGGQREKNKKRQIMNFEIRIGRVGGTCGKKP